MFRGPFHIGMELLGLRIYRRTGQPGTQQPDPTFLRQGERRRSENYPRCIFPLDHLRQPIEQQRRRVHIAPFNRAFLSPGYRRGVPHALKKSLRRATGARSPEDLKRARAVP